jgi:hypothetical protein
MDLRRLVVRVLRRQLAAERLREQRLSQPLDPPARLRHSPLDRVYQPIHT